MNNNHIAIGLLIGIVGLLMEENKEKKDTIVELEKWLSSQEEKKEGYDKNG